MKSIPIISTFSGGGFLDIGFLNQGFQIEEAFEIEPHFIRGYNYGLEAYISKSQKKEIVASKIQHNHILKESDISLPTIQKKIGEAFYNSIEGMIGGPPCQDYSIGGKNVGVEGKRGRLILSYLEIVRLTQPNFIFFENVSGLFNTRNHQSAFFDLVKNLEKLKYTIWYDVLNALNFGVPQDRARLVLVGFKDSIVKKLIKNNYVLIDENKQSDELVFKWPKQEFVNPKFINWPKTWKLGSAIIKKELNQIPKSYEKLQVINAFKNLDSSFPNQDEYFQPYSNKFNEILEGDTYRKSFKRLHRYRYSPTVAYGNNEVHLHPTLPRRLSVREALRLQTVPDSYVLPSDIPLTHKFKLISNGVPTRMASLIAREIKRTMNNYYAIK